MKKSEAHPPVPDVVSIDLRDSTVTVTFRDREEVIPLDNPRAFESVSDAWLRAGWDAKHVYSFTWLGRPIIQLPEDLVRTQEVISAVRPDVIVETGVAHGGSLVFYASLCRALGNGRVIGIDVDIRSHNREALEDHDLFDLITLIEGSSTDPEVVAQVGTLIDAGERVLVVLDSDHHKDHVLAELRAYAPLVSVGSFVAVADGLMERLAGAPRTLASWAYDNPRSAIEEFLEESDDFVSEEPEFAFNEGTVRRPVTYWLGGWLRRVRKPPSCRET